MSRRTGRSRFTLVLLVLTSVTLITLDVRGDGNPVLDGLRAGALEAWAPVHAVGEAVVSPIGDVFGSILNYSDLEAENERLREQLEAQRGAQLRRSDVERQLQELQDLLELDAVGDIPSVAARVVSNDPANFEVTMEIDRGSNHGVAENMPVVAGAGLVGRVIEVSPGRSTVLLLTDSTFSVGVRLAESGDVGLAEGRGRDERLAVDLVEASTSVSVGELLVTSGLQGSLFPAGIPVGEVTSERLRAGSLLRDVRIRPTVDINELSVVKVLQWSPEVAQ